MPRAIVINLSSNGDYWQADWKDAAGRRCKKSIGSKSVVSRRQAKKLCQRMQEMLHHQPALGNTGEVPLLGAYLRGYIDSRQELRPATLALLDLSARYLIKCFGEKKPIDQITRQNARDWRTSLARGELSLNNEIRPMAEVSVCHRCADAKSMFKRAVDDGALLSNPFVNLKTRPPRPDRNWHYVSRQQCCQLLDACPNTGWKLLIALCRLAGLRRGEASNLPWSAVDWHQRRLTVFAQKTARFGGNKRIVPIDPQLFDLLHEAKGKANPKAERICDDVSEHCLWRNFTVIRKRAGLHSWKDAFQVMRRNCETDWAQQYPQYAVSEWLGHSIMVSAMHYLAIPEELYLKVSEGIRVGSSDQSEFAPKNAPKSESSDQ